MTLAGIDIGSRYIKYALLENGESLALVRRETGYDPLPTCRALMEEMRADRILATGYGRHLLEEDRGIRHDHRDPGGGERCPSLLSILRHCH